MCSSDLSEVALFNTLLREEPSGILAVEECPVEMIPILTHMTEIGRAESFLTSIHYSLTQKSNLIETQNKIIRLLAHENQEYDRINTKYIESLVLQSKIRLADLTSKWGNSARSYLTVKKKKLDFFKPFTQIVLERNSNSERRDNQDIDMGGDLEYADEVTLARALEGRRELE